MVAMEDSRAYDTANKVKVRQVVRVDPAIGIDLQGVDIITGRRDFF